MAIDIFYNDDVENVSLCISGCTCILLYVPFLLPIILLSAENQRKIFTILVVGCCVRTFYFLLSPVKLVITVVSPRLILINNY